MASLNKVILIGNLTADPELKQTQSGISVVSFTIAINRRYQSKNAPEGQQTADFIMIRINILLHCQCLVNIKINKLSAAVSDYTVACALTQQIHCARTHDRRIITIQTCRASASLHVAEDGCSGLNAGCHLNPLRHAC